MGPYCRHPGRNGGRSAGGKKWSDSGCYLKVEPVRLVTGRMWGVKERDKDACSFRLSHKKDVVVLVGMGRLGEMRDLGRGEKFGERFSCRYLELPVECQETH